MTARLRVESLNAYYGHARILFDVSFEVGRGEVVALMGRNGAGKSTTMKAIMSMVPRKSGEIVCLWARTSARGRRIVSRAAGWVMCPRIAACSAISP